MPIAPGTQRAAVVAGIPAGVVAYNAAGAVYNDCYAKYIGARAAGVGGAGGLHGWLGAGGPAPNAATSIMALLTCFGMNSRSSVLVATGVFAASLAALPAAVNLAAIAPFSLALASMNGPPGGPSPRVELENLFAYCSFPGKFSQSGGYVIASKVAHCILPDICPMLDGEHTGISLHHVKRASYLPPGGNWVTYLGRPVRTPVNPSPSGAGRANWDSSRFVQAIGFYARLYQDWQAANANLGILAFLAIDAVSQTSIPRVLDRALW